MRLDTSRAVTSILLFRSDCGAGGRFPAKQLMPYIVAQVLGGIVAGGILYLIASGKAGFDASAGFASNGYGAHSPGGYTMLAALDNALNEVGNDGTWTIITHGNPGEIKIDGVYVKGFGTDGTGGTCGRAPVRLGNSARTGLTVNLASCYGAKVPDGARSVARTSQDEIVARGGSVTAMRAIEDPVDIQCFKNSTATRRPSGITHAEATAFRDSRCSRNTTACKQYSIALQPPTATDAASRPSPSTASRLAPSSPSERPSPTASKRAARKKEPRSSTRSSPAPACAPSSSVTRRGRG